MKYHITSARFCTAFAEKGQGFFRFSAAFFLKTREQPQKNGRRAGLQKEKFPKKEDMKSGYAADRKNNTKEL